MNEITHTHHWLCGTTISGHTPATCKICGEEREFIDPLVQGFSESNATGWRMQPMGFTPRSHEWYIGGES
jgi:hypothetical protein